MWKETEGVEGEKEEGRWKKRRMYRRNRGQEGVKCGIGGGPGKNEGGKEGVKRRKEAEEGDIRRTGEGTENKGVDKDVKSGTGKNGRR
jgi:hypothetical protein